MKDYYKILGVSRNVTQAELKKRFRELAIKKHPDVNKSPNAHQEFIEIMEAYEILSNQILRNEFDSFDVRKTDEEEFYQSENWEKYYSDIKNKSRYYAYSSIENFKKDFKEGVEEYKTVMKDASINFLWFIVFIIVFSLIMSLLF
ncbi:DnaJ domain-containing protein [Balneolaceae bacterium ANBcel3]|nr:DnaJ domain-containing protein [Balneolaceae bacterium ANBcel3]